MYRIIMTVVAAILILAAGFLHGRIIDRWGDSHEMTEAVAKLQNLNPSFGDWVSQDVEANPRHLQVAEINGHVYRQYANKSSGERVSILLICGKPGPISVHTPDVCYEGAGYKMGTKSAQAMRNITSSRAPEFWTARFTKEPHPVPLNILWGWSTGGLWSAPDNPRLVFFRSKVLYKLYVIREAKGLDTPVIDETTSSFLKDFYPVLQKALSGQSEPVSP